MQAGRQKLRNFFLLLNIIVAVLYILNSLSPVLNAGDFWFIAIIGLAFPFLFFLNLLFIIIWAIARSKWVILSTVAMLLSIQQIGVNFSFRLKKEFEISRPDDHLRVLSWNVSRWDERNKQKRGGTSYRPLMMDCIAMQEADILCLQEFFEPNDPGRFEPNLVAVQKLGFPYYYFFQSSQLFEGKLKYGMTIFSRYPIIDSAKFYIDINDHSEGLSYADVQTPGGVVRVFSMHFQSVGFTSTDHEDVGKLRNSRGILSKLKNSYAIRSRQVDMASKIISASPHPTILCGDLNDVPSSYAYFTIRGSMQDAFAKKGSGLGPTYRFLSKTLRIDYIMADKKFRIEQFGSVKLPYSDHYPLVADLSFK